jgi:hypothetical protein
MPHGLAEIAGYAVYIAETSGVRPLTVARAAGEGRLAQ